MWNEWRIPLSSSILYLFLWKNIDIFYTGGSDVIVQLCLQEMLRHVESYIAVVLIVLVNVMPFNSLTWNIPIASVLAVTATVVTSVVDIRATDKHWLFILYLPHIYRDFSRIIKVLFLLSISANIYVKGSVQYTQVLTNRHPLSWNPWRSQVPWLRVFPP